MVMAGVTPVKVASVSHPSTWRAPVIERLPRCRVRSSIQHHESWRSL
jgi:hypothetical protein